MVPCRMSSFVNLHRRCAFAVSTVALDVVTSDALHMEGCEPHGVRKLALPICTELVIRHTSPAQVVTVVVDVQV